MNEYQFVREIQKHFDNEDFYSLREIGVGYGIADLVLINKGKINIENCRARKNNNQFSPLLNENFFKTLRYIPDEESENKHATFSDIAESSCLSKSYLKYKILTFLESHGYVKQDKDNFYLKVNGWIPIAQEIIAIEAKLCNWRRGALQANRYKAFAHKVYLAIPESKEHIVDKDYFMKHEIGLMVIDTKRKNKKIVIDCPSKEPFNKNKFYFALEYFWGDLQLENFAKLKFQETI